MKFTDWIQCPNGWQHLTYHPLSNVIGFGVGIDVEALAARMKEDGYDEDEPIILWRNRETKVDEILDGRHRHAGAVIAGVTPTFRRFVGKSAEAYVAKKAFRQHLSTSQRALLAAMIVNTTVGSNQHAKEGRQNCPPSTTADAAKTMNVSERTVKSAKKVVDEGTPALQEAVADETITVSDAAKVADEPAKVQDEAVGKVREGKAKSAKAAAKKIKDETPCEREPGEEVEQVKDAVGFVVPFKALRAFEDAKKINAICKELDGVIARVEEIGKAPGGRMLHTTSQTQTLQQVRKSLWAGRATHVCPYCKGEKKKCDPCKDTGWLDKVSWKNAPEGLRNEMEAAK